MYSGISYQTIHLLADKYSKELGLPSHQYTTRFRQQMIPLRRTLSKILTTAGATAFPIEDSAIVQESRVMADYTSDYPSQIFNKYKQGRVAFGVFNPRQVADGLFVNISRQEYLSSTTISPTGNLDFSIHNEYLLLTAEKLLNQKYFKIEYQVSSENFVLPVDGFEPFNIRQLLLAQSLRNTHNLFGNRPELYLLQSQGQVQGLDNVSHNQINLLFRCPLTQIKNDSNSDRLSFQIQHWPKKANYLYKYHEDSHAFRLKKKCKSSKFTRVGDLMMEGNPRLDEFIAKVIQLGEGRIAKCYENLSTSLAATKYFAMKYPQSETIKVDKELLNRTEGSFFAVLSVYNYITLNLKHVDLDRVKSISKDDLGDVRDLLLKVAKLPDVLIDCLEESSMHRLGSWLGDFCSHYMRVESRYSSELREKVDLLVKLVIENSLELVTIDTYMLYLEDD